jgi:ubiquinone/menaquinone biosynthesis C-methylase UbiE
MTEYAFTPALGRVAPPQLFDRVAAATRERLWRSLVVMYAAPRPGDVIVDVGCGTGSLALLLNRVQPESRILGIDPDPRVLAVARQKSAACATVQWQVGMGDALADTVPPGTVDIVVSSLVLHQCPVPMKRAVLASMCEILRPGGRLVIADYGRQRSLAMRLAFGIVQLADGVGDTRPNAEGIVPKLMSATGFRRVHEVEVVSTLTGSISIYVAGRE